MLKKTPLLLCCIWLLLLPGLAFADDSSTFARLYHSDEPILTVLTAQEGTVLAVVDEFPILEEDVDFTFALAHVLGQPRTKEEIFNRMLEDRALHSQAWSLGLLPTDEEVDAALEQLHTTIISDDESQKQLEAICAAVPIREDIYWYGFERYNQFHQLAAKDLYTTLTEEGLAAKAPDLDAYYSQKLLAWKQSCTVTLSPDCPYRAVTDALVKAQPHSRRTILYGGQTAAPSKAGPPAHASLLDSRALLFIVIAAVLILIYAAVSKHLSQK